MDLNLGSAVGAISPLVDEALKNPEVQDVAQQAADFIAQSNKPEQAVEETPAPWKPVKKYPAPGTDEFKNLNYFDQQRAIRLDSWHQDLASGKVDTEDAMLDGILHDPKLAEIDDREKNLRDAFADVAGKDVNGMDDAEAQAYYMNLVEADPRFGFDDDYDGRKVFGDEAGTGRENLKRLLDVYTGIDPNGLLSREAQNWLASDEAQKLRDAKEHFQTNIAVGGGSVTGYVAPQTIVNYSDKELIDMREHQIFANERTVLFASLMSTLPKESQEVVRAALKKGELTKEMMTLVPYGDEESVMSAFQAANPKVDANWWLTQGAMKAFEQASGLVGGAWQEMKNVYLTTGGRAPVGSNQLRSLEEEEIQRIKLKNANAYKFKDLTFGGNVLAGIIGNLPFGLAYTNPYTATVANLGIANDAREKMIDAGVDQSYALGASMVIGAVEAKVEQMQWEGVFGKGLSEFALRKAAFPQTLKKLFSAEFKDACANIGKMGREGLVTTVAETTEEVLQGMAEDIGVEHGLHGFSFNDWDTAKIVNNMVDTAIEVFPTTLGFGIMRGTGMGPAMHRMLSGRARTIQRDIGEYLNQLNLARNSIDAVDGLGERLLGEVQKNGKNPVGDLIDELGRKWDKLETTDERMDMLTDAGLNPDQAAILNETFEMRESIFADTFGDFGTGDLRYNVENLGKMMKGVADVKRNDDGSYSMTINVGGGNKAEVTISEKNRKDLVELDRAQFEKQAKGNFDQHYGEGEWDKLSEGEKTIYLENSTPNGITMSVGDTEMPLKYAVYMASGDIVEETQPGGKVKYARRNGASQQQLAHEIFHVATLSATKAGIITEADKAKFREVFGERSGYEWDEEKAADLYGAWLVGKYEDETGVFNKIRNFFRTITDKLRITRPTDSEFGEAAETIFKAIEQGDLRQATVAAGINAEENAKARAKRDGTSVGVAQAQEAYDRAKESLDVLKAQAKSGKIGRNNKKLKEARMAFRAAEADLKAAGGGSRLSVGELSPDMFFSPAEDGTVDVPVDSLASLKNEPARSVSNAAKFMGRSSRGEMDKRGPVSLADNGDGTYTVVDGNATARAAKALGLKNVRGRIVGRNLGTRLANSGYLVKNVDAAGEIDEDGKLRTRGLDGLSGTDAREKMYKQAEENAPKLEQIVDGALVKLNKVEETATKMMRKSLKKRERVDDKAKNDYAGDYSRVVDLIGGTVVLNDNGDFSDAIKYLGKAAEAQGAKIAKVKKLNFTPDAKGYRDVKVSIRFANGGVGEVIVVDAYVNDAKFNRGGHKVYEITRVLEKYIGENKVIYDAYNDLGDLADAIYERGPGALDEAEFERAKSKASSSVTLLMRPNVAALLSEEDIKTLKSLSSATNLARPPSTDSYATPAESLMKYIPSPSDYEEIVSNFGGEVNGKNGNTSRMSLVTPAENAAYMDAVKRGDTDAAMEMVREAALRSMPNVMKDFDGNPLVVYRGISVDAGRRSMDFLSPYSAGSDGVDYTMPNGGGQYGPGVYFTFDKDIAGGYGNHLFSCFVEARKIADYDDAEEILGKTADEDVGDPAKDMTMFEGHPESIAKLVAAGYDGFLDEGNGGFVLWNRDMKIKSADPVAYDDAGNLIPLSKRFSRRNPDIRYSLVTPEQANAWMPNTQVVDKDGNPIPMEERGDLNNEDIRYSLKEAPTVKADFDKVKERFGVTDDINSAHWILPDGSLIDMNAGPNPVGDRYGAEHADISEVLGITSEQFENAGAIRVRLDDSPVIDLRVKPTEAQMDKIYDFEDAAESIIEDTEDVVTVGYDNNAYDELDERSIRSLVSRVRNQSEDGSDSRFSLILGEKGAANLNDGVQILENLKVGKDWIGGRDWEDLTKEEKLKFKLATGWEMGVDGKWRHEVPDINRGLISNGETDLKDQQVKLEDERKVILKQMNDLVRKMNVEYARLKRDNKEEAESFWGLHHSTVMADTVYAKLSDEHDKLDAEYKKLGRKIGALKRKATKSKLGSISTTGNLTPFIEGTKVAEAYPRLMKIGLEFRDFSGYEYGHYDPNTNTIVINSRTPSEEMERTLIHEIQHAIQHIEGFAVGGNPEQFSREQMSAKQEQMWRDLCSEIGFINIGDGVDELEKKIDSFRKIASNDKFPEAGKKANAERLAKLEKIATDNGYANLDAGVADIKKHDAYRTPFGQYHRLAGEVESRNASVRGDGYLHKLLEDTEDESRDVQIVRGVVQDSLDKIADARIAEATSQTLPAGKQKSAGVLYPDASGEVRAMPVGESRFSFKDEAKALILKKRADLWKINYEDKQLQKEFGEDNVITGTYDDPWRGWNPKYMEFASSKVADGVVSELMKFADSKTRKAALNWFVRGAIRLPEDAQKVEQAMRYAANAKGRANTDALSYDSPQAMIEALHEFKPKEKPIDPDTVPELTDRREMGHGVVTYLVRDDRAGQQAMRRIINTHWGEDANPWCLLQGDGAGNLSDGSNGGYDAWYYWQHYNALPKRVAFLNGKLLAFMATDASDFSDRRGEWLGDGYVQYQNGGGELDYDDWVMKYHPDFISEYGKAPEQWWDRLDHSHDGIPLGNMEVPNDPFGRWADYEIIGGNMKPIGGFKRGEAGKDGYLAWFDNGFIFQSLEGGVSREWLDDGTLYQYRDKNSGLFFSINRTDGNAYISNVEDLNTGAVGWWEANGSFSMPQVNSLDDGSFAFSDKGSWVTADKDGNVIKMREMRLREGSPAWYERKEHGYHEDRESAAKKAKEILANAEKVKSLREEAERIFAKSSQSAPGESRLSLSLGVPYQGSKGQIAEDLIGKLPEGGRFVDLFSGGGAMTHAAMKSGKYASFRMNDLDGRGQDLFLGAMSGQYKGYEKEQTQDDWDAIKDTPEGILRSRMGNGRQFNADAETSARNLRRVNRVADDLGGRRGEIEATKEDYRDVQLRDGDVVYADIPYAGTDTTAYNNRVGSFDHAAFDQWAQAQNVPVYVSSYAMPDGWTCVYEVQTRGIRGMKTERLFVHDRFAHKGTFTVGSPETRGQATGRVKAGSAKDGVTRFSVSSGLDAAGLTYGKGEDGRLRIVLPNGKLVTSDNPCTAKDIMDADSPLMHLVDLGIKKGTVGRNKADGQKIKANIAESFAQCFNLAAKWGDTDDGVSAVDAMWRWVGDNIFKAIKQNSDKQYGTSVDVLTICKKTDMLMQVVSDYMKKQKRGAMPTDIMNLYLETGKAAFQTPCPVCYVFSRWIRAGYDRQTAWEAQNRFADLVKEHDPSTPDGKEFWKAEYNKYYIPDEAKDQNPEQKVRAKAVSEAKKTMTLGYQLFDKAMREGDKEAAERINAEIAKAFDVLRDADFAGFIKYCIYDADGDTAWGDFKPVPSDVIFDFRAAAEIARNYPALRRYYGSKGSAGGKAIETEANNDFGDIVEGIAANGGEFSNNLKAAFSRPAGSKERKEALKAFDTDFGAALAKSIRQRLIGGQRFFSWSDNRVEFGFDMMMNLLQVQILGDSIQSYSKQLEGAELLTKHGAYNNGSLMGAGNGLEPATEGEEGAILLNGKWMKLKFSDIQGINHEELFKLNKTYDKSGNILVGMNDDHIRVALRDERIFFIIPWHASGLGTGLLDYMLSALGEDAHGTETDYSPVQSEHEMSGKSVNADVKALFDRAEANGSGLKSCIKVDHREGEITDSQKEYRRLRTAILTGTATQEDVDLAMKDEFLSRIVLDLQDAAQELGGAKANGRYVKKHLAKPMMFMTSAAVESVYPYEYWDRTSTYGNASVNSARYLEYCRRLGWLPKFCGLVIKKGVTSPNGQKWDKKKGWVGTKYGDFTDEENYWKLLIDRRMYARDGSYQHTTQVQMATPDRAFDVDTINPDSIEAKWGKLVTKKANSAQVGAIVDAVIEKQREQGYALSRLSLSEGGGSDPEDVIAAMVAARKRQAKPMNVEEVKKLLVFAGRPTDNADEVLARADSVAMKLGETMNKSAEAYVKPSMYMNAATAEARKQRLIRAADLAGRRGYKLGRADAELVEKVERQQEAAANAAIEAATGMKAADMESAYGIDFVKTVQAAALAKYNHGHAREIDPEDKPGEVNGEGLPIDVEAEKKAKEESAKEPELVDAPLSDEAKRIAERAKARADAIDAKFELKNGMSPHQRAVDAENTRAEQQSEEAGENPDVGEVEGGEGEGAVEKKKQVKREKLSFERASDFVAFCEEMVLDDMKRRGDKNAALADPFKESPVAARELANTAKSILTKVARALTYSLDRESIMRNLEKLSDVRNIDGIEAAIMNNYSRIQEKLIPQTQAKMIKTLIKEGDRLAKDGKRFVHREEDRNRKVTGAVSQWWSYVRKYFDMSEEEVAAETTVLNEIIHARLDEVKDASYDMNLDLKYRQALDRLAALTQYGGLINRPVGEISDKARDIIEMLQGKRADMEDKREEDRIKNQMTSETIKRAVVNPKAQAENKKPNPGWFTRMMDSMMGILYVRMRDLIRFSSGEIRRKAEVVLRNIEDAIALASQNFNVYKVRQQRAFDDIMKQLYGSSQDGVRHLTEQLDEEDRKLVSKQGVAELTRSWLLQRYVELLQGDDYARNIHENHRDGKWREDFDKVFNKYISSTDLAFLNWMRDWYRDNLAELNEKVLVPITGVKQYSPGEMYFPMKMLVPKRDGVDTKAVTWSPLPAWLTPRVRNSYDFDENMDLLTMWYRRMNESGVTLSYAQLGINLSHGILNGSLKEEIAKNHGDVALRRLVEHVGDIISGGGREIVNSDDATALADRLRAWQTNLTLSCNYVSAIKQMVSTPTYALRHDINFGMVAKFMCDVDMGAVRELMASDGWTSRYGNGMNEAIQNAMRNNGVASTGVGAGLRDAIGRLYNAGFKLMEFGDSVPCVWVGQGLYRYFVTQITDKEGGEAVMTPEEIKQKALTRTWAIIEMCQQSKRTENLTAAQRGGPLGRLLYQFVSSPVQQLAYEVQAVREALAARGTDHFDDARAHLGRVLVINHLLIPSLLRMAAIVAMLPLGSIPDPEDELWQAIYNLLMGQFGCIFMAGTVGESTYNAVLRGKFDYRANGLPIEGIVDIFQHLGITAHDLLTVDTDGLQHDLLNLIRDTGAPGRQAVKAWKNWTK